MSADVFWIKLLTNTFDSETIILLESMPEGDTLIIIWLKMQILAGKCNSGGYLFLSGDKPYSDEMLATVFRRPLNTVRLAIAAFLEFGMVEIIDSAYFLPEWERHQNVSGLEKIREQTKQRVARHRAGAKDVTLQVTQSNATETDAEKENKKEKQHNDIRILFADTPLCRITVQELSALAVRHGTKQLMLTADVAAETWRRDKRDIQNPGGYLQSLCSSLVVPSWYLSPESRKTKAKTTEERRLASNQAREAKDSEGEKELIAIETYWCCISEEDRHKFHLAAKESNSGFEIPSAIFSIAKNFAWQSRKQMNT